MHTLKSYAHNILGLWKRQSIAQKSTLVYFIVLFCALLFLPLITISSVIDNAKEHFGLYTTATSKIAFVLTLILLKLFARNASEHLRNRIYSIFGFQASLPLVNFMGISICFLFLLAMVDTIKFVQYHISEHITMARGWAVIAVLLLVGMLRQLIIARLQRKQKLKQHEVHSQQSHYHQQQEFYLDKQQERLL